MSALKRKKCKAENCNNFYDQFRSTQSACSVDCALEIAKAKTVKQYKLETYTLKRDFRANDRAHQLKLTQAEFNKFIRLRDEGKPCISCGRHHPGQNHAGHYLSVGAHPELRFEESNVHLQCAPCNNHLSGNIIEYRKGLLNRIGPFQLEWLEGPHKAANYTLEDIKKIRAESKAKIKNLDRIKWD